MRRRRRRRERSSSGHRPRSRSHRPHVASPPKRGFHPNLHTNPHGRCHHADAIRLDCKYSSGEAMASPDCDATARECLSPAGRRARPSGLMQQQSLSPAGTR